MNQPLNIKTTTHTAGGQINFQTDPMSPMGRNIMWIGAEGGCKTWLNLAESVCLASGNRFLGMRTERCPVLIIDEETPTEDLEDRLYRLNSNWRQLPITIASKEGFYFSQRNRTVLEDVKRKIGDTVNKLPNARNVAIRIDSVTACLGGGQQRLHENDAQAGSAIFRTCRDIRDFCKQQLGKEATITLLAHGKKVYASYDIDDLRQLEMQELVRGHGSIVGEGCDVGYVIKKIADNPLCGVIIPKIRRTRTPILETYFQLKEQQYMKGEARLKQINPIPIPPSPMEVEYYLAFCMADKSDPNRPRTYKENDLMRMAASHEAEERRVALQHLKKHHVIIQVDEPFTFRINLNLDMTDDYNRQLDESAYRQAEEQVIASGEWQIEDKNSP